MKKRVMYIIITIFTLSLVFSIINIVKWSLDNKKINNQITEINDNVEIIETNDNTEIIEQVDLKQNDPYWKYINMNLIDVDLHELTKLNDQVKGWIQVNGTNINYPFVQTTDNSFYLDHSFNKSYNKAGWVFLDYRNDINILDKNTIIYGHNRADKTMFGSLKDIVHNEWYTNSDNYIVKLSTEKENSLWQVFSIYHIPTTSDYIQTEFNSDSEYQELLNVLLGRSIFDFKTSVKSSDKILTLSSCYNKTEKVVLHAKLIKTQQN